MSFWFRFYVNKFPISKPKPRGYASPLHLKTPRVAGDDFFGVAVYGSSFEATALHSYEKAIAFTFDPRHLHLSLRFLVAGFFCVYRTISVKANKAGQSVRKGTKGDILIKIPLSALLGPFLPLFPLLALSLKKALHINL